VPDPSIHRPLDATLSVTKAARVLGVHPNTVRSWSDQGRLRYYRINPRGDRRYAVADLQRFLASAVARSRPGDGADHARPNRRGDGSASALIDLPPALDTERHHVDLRLLAGLANLTAVGRDLDATLARAVALVREAFGCGLVGVWELRDDMLVARAIDVSGPVRLADVPAQAGSLGRALATGGVVANRAEGSDPGWPSLVPNLRAEAAVPIRADPDGAPWGVLLAAADDKARLADGDLELLDGIAQQFGVAVYTARLLDDAARQLHRADALRRVASDISSKLDLDQILTGLVDHAMVLFEADRAAVFLRHRDGHVVAEVARGLSPSYLAAVRDVPAPSLPSAAMAARRPLFSVGYRADPASAGVRAAVIQEGFDTLCSAPLFDGAELLGLLNVYHDRPHAWTPDELDTIDAFAAQASVAIKTAQNFEQMATWAAQLQSIQQLGARLNRLSSVGEIGHAIATELRQLIDYHNVRVYRIVGEDDLAPVAMLGQVGEYSDETPEQLRVKVGSGITGWVAAHGVAEYLPDAASDPRANTIPGTEPDLDESMLLAPMGFEDRVLGVLVLSKLGLNQFSQDDLRLLVIYASFAAQAMANADATELLRAQSATLERQVRSQRELLQITESILGTLEPRAVVDQIADRLGALVRYDNISIELYDRAAGVLRPLSAKGIHAADFLAPWEIDEEGLATWVIEHNEPQLVVDELADPRVVQFESTGPVEGSLIVVPLRKRDGVAGVLTLERLGTDDRFTTEEFELVQLFAAQVSIALQNAEIHSAVEIRAQTDDLTGLLNHGTFQEMLALEVLAGGSFSLIMLDLDEFKAVNDALGHQAGDRFLRDVARALVGAGRDKDRAFRYGGDEFVLLLAETGPAGARIVAERVRDAVHAVGAPGTTWHDEGVEVSCSIGLATHPIDGHTPASVLLAADRACFVAKRNGRGRIATAAEGRSLTTAFSLQEPTPVDPPTVDGAG
jgi:diguanylate cyclase (GGDEF)-like protein/excisionase family DNA binding protein